MKNFEYKINLSETQLTDYKRFKQIINGNSQDNNLVLSEYFIEFDKSPLKKFKKRKDGFGNYLIIEKILDFLHILNFHVFVMIKKERERAFKQLFNKKEAVKHGFVDENEYKKLNKKMPKQSEQQIIEWANKIYPNIDDAVWEHEFFISLLEKI